MISSRSNIWQSTVLIWNVRISEMGGVRIFFSREERFMIQKHVSETFSSRRLFYKTLVENTPKSRMMMLGSHCWKFSAVNTKKCLKSLRWILLNTSSGFFGVPAAPQCLLGIVQTPCQKLYYVPMFARVPGKVQSFCWVLCVTSTGHFPESRTTLLNSFRGYFGIQARDSPESKPKVTRVLTWVLRRNSYECL